MILDSSEFYLEEVIRDVNKDSCTRMFIVTLFYFILLLLVFKEIILEGLLYFFIFYTFILFIYLFLAVLGLRCCVPAFSSCGEWGLLFVAVRGLLIVVASLVVEHGL